MTATCTPSFQSVNVHRTLTIAFTGVRRRRSAWSQCCTSSITLYVDEVAGSSSMCHSVFETACSPFDVLSVGAVNAHVRPGWSCESAPTPGRSQQSLPHSLPVARILLDPATFSLFIHSGFPPAKLPNSTPNQTQLRAKLCCNLTRSSNSTRCSLSIRARRVKHSVNGGR